MWQKGRTKTFKTNCKKCKKFGNGKRKELKKNKRKRKLKMVKSSLSNGFKCDIANYSIFSYYNIKSIFKMSDLFKTYEQ